MIWIKISVATDNESDLYCSFHSRLITWIQLTHTRLKLPLLSRVMFQSMCSLFISSQYWCQHQKDFLRRLGCWEYWPKTLTCTAQQSRACSDHPPSAGCGTSTSLNSLWTNELCKVPHSPCTVSQLTASQFVWEHLERKQLDRGLAHGLFPIFPKPGGRGRKLLVFLLPIHQMQRRLSCVPLRRSNLQALFTTAASAQLLTGPGNISSATTVVQQLPSASFQIKEKKSSLSLHSRWTW